MEKNKDAYEFIQKLFEEKKKSSNDSKKIETIDKLFKRNLCFFEISVKNALKILLFLGVPREDVMSVYEELISPENYLKRRKDIKIIIPTDDSEGLKK